MASTSDAARSPPAALKPRGYILSHLSAVHACIDRLGIGVPTAWLYGVSGYAFMLNIPRGVCCSGPTAWNWRSIAQRTPLLGVDLSEFVYANMKDEDFAARKQQAIAFTQRMLDEGVPLYGCELGFPEFYTVTSVDDGGFAYTWTNLLHMQPVAVRRTWEKFGNVDVGVLFVGAVKAAPADADPARAMAAALAFAVEVGHADPGFLGGESVGLRGYDAWGAALSDGSLSAGPWCHPHGTTHNAACWWECRGHAGEFLVLCSERIGGDLRSRFVRAAERYRAVAESLARIKALFPWGMSDKLPSAEVVAQATSELRAAKDSEHRGLDILEEIRRAL